MNALRDGRWVTRQRIRVYSLIFLCVTIGSIAALCSGRHNLNDAQGRPLGTDFSNVFAAGSYARQGHAERAYDPERQHKRQKQMFGKDTPFYGWHYPPFFLLVAGVLATLPYLWALLAWQAATFALYLRAQWLVLPDKLALLAAAAFPAVLINAAHGHNGFLTAALLGLGLLWLPARPILAGILLGLLAYKPQFGVLIPLALLASMHGRAFASAAVTVLLLGAASTWAFGPEIWAAFADSAEFTRRVVLEQGDTGFHKIQTVFAWARLWGANVTQAYAAQTLVQLLAALLVWRVWRSPQSHEIKAAALIVGCLLFTPYMLDYDLMALAPAMAFWVRAGARDGFAPYERTMLAVSFALPLVARLAAQHALLPVGVWSLLLLGLLLYRRARR